MTVQPANLDPLPALFETEGSVPRMHNGSLKRSRTAPPPLPSDSTVPPQTRPSPLQVRNKPGYAFLVCRINQGRFAQTPFPFCGLFCENVIGKSLVPRYLPRSRGLEPLGRTTVGFYLRHFCSSIYTRKLREPPSCSSKDLRHRPQRLT